MNNNIIGESLDSKIVITIFQYTPKVVKIFVNKIYIVLFVLIKFVDPPCSVAPSHLKMSEFK